MFKRGRGIIIFLVFAILAWAAGKSVVEVGNGRINKTGDRFRSLIRK